jgi:hypothetical protein
MVNTLNTNPGLINNAGTARALYLKVFAGEVLAQFNEKNIVRPHIQIRTIPYGKQASFPVFGKAQASLHTPGHNIFESSSTTPDGEIMNQFKHNERIINVDVPIIAPTMVHSLDEILNHFDLRSQYANQLGLVLSNTFDIFGLAIIHIASAVGYNGSTAPADMVTGEPMGGFEASNVGGAAVPTDNTTYQSNKGGYAYVDATLSSSGPAVAKALFTISAAMNMRDIPQDGRYAVITPAMFLNVIKDPTLYTFSGVAGTAPTLQLNAPTGTSASYGSVEGWQSDAITLGGASWNRPGATIDIAGITVMWSNHIPNSDQSGAGTADKFLILNAMGAVTGANASYKKSYAATVGLVWHESAVACLMIRDISLETEWRMEYQSDAILAKMLTGFGYLRPGSCFRLQTS